jgi:hypothetical protein
VGVSLSSARGKIREGKRVSHDRTRERERMERGVATRTRRSGGEREERGSVGIINGREREWGVRGREIQIMGIKEERGSVINTG